MWESRRAVHYHPSGSWLQLGFMIGIHDHDDDDDDDDRDGGDSDDAIVHYTIIFIHWDAVGPTCDALCTNSTCNLVGLICSPSSP